MRVSLTGLVLAVIGSVQSSPVARAAKPPQFFLIGDSTVAIDGGWGNGFLSYLNAPAKGDNRGVSGSTTVSWKSNGRWDTLIKDVSAAKADFEPVVTIQFGHNDQKVMQLDEFHANLVDIGNQIKEAGGTPASLMSDLQVFRVLTNHQIFITSLTRRTFQNGEVVQNLKEWAAETVAAAGDVGAQYLELNKASTDYVNAIGNENAQRYNWGEGDRTHLNPAGEIVFGRMVADLLLEAREDFSSYFTPNKALSDKIAKGEFANGDE
ncbi:putative acetylesterase [Fusarium denticulatum]|uniref:Putative acetylesterase n=1 Tax=Fusarium denticulatum TaxID=48507 RepID=A0A8H5T5V5_9HYPO|nr:putative acetylesterase [Fusarium denticulatum]